MPASRASGNVMLGTSAARLVSMLVSQAGAALNAMAAEVEVVVSDQPVRVGEAELSAGESQTVTDTSYPSDVCTKVYKFLFVMCIFHSVYSAFYHCNCF